MKRVLFTGASGFVGSNLLRRLLSEGHEICLFLREGYNLWRLRDISSDVLRLEISLRDKDGLQRSLAHFKPDWIFHLAAYGAYSSQSDFPQMVDTNLLGLSNLLDCCTQIGFEAFVNSGSSSEYGLKNHPPTESETIHPNSTYAITKSAATHLCQYMAQKHDLCIRTLRLYSVYGPYEEPTRFLPTLIQYGLKGSLPPLVDPKIARDFVHVDDVVEAYLSATRMTDRHKDSVYNVGTGVQTTIEDVVEVARQEMAIPVRPKWGSMNNRQWDTSIWVADYKTITSHLGWQPKIAFAEGFRKTVSWFEQHHELKKYYETVVK